MTKRCLNVPASTHIHLILHAGDLIVLNDAQKGSTLKCSLKKTAVMRVFKVSGE